MICSLVSFRELGRLVNILSFGSSEFDLFKQFLDLRRLQIVRLLIAFLLLTQDIFFLQNLKIINCDHFVIHTHECEHLTELGSLRLSINNNIVLRKFFDSFLNVLYSEAQHRTVAF